LEKEIKEKQSTIDELKDSLEKYSKLNEKNEKEIKELKENLNETKNKLKEESEIEKKKIIE